MSTETIVVIVAIPPAVLALIALVKMTGIGHIPKNWATGILAVSRRIANSTSIIHKKAARHITIAKRRLELRWTIWRKKVKVNIKGVLDQDMDLKDVSATLDERVGMAAISLVQVLSSDGAFQSPTHQQVFALIRNTDTKQFHMLCARMAAFIVKTSELETDALATQCVLPWDSVLEKFLKAALDEPPVDEGFKA